MTPYREPASLPKEEHQRSCSQCGTLLCGCVPLHPVARSLVRSAGGMVWILGGWMLGTSISNLCGWGPHVPWLAVVLAPIIIGAVGIALLLVLATHVQRAIVKR